MIDLDSQNIPFYWANEFWLSLTDLGVSHVVISPGSRSTPLTLAADANPALSKHVILDERSAGYTALGIGKSTGLPAALICTSGTAAANYYPAVIEARQAGVPLLLLTADRPPKQRDIGANQAIDQLRMYGGYPVWFHDVGEPRLAETDLRRLRTAGSQAFHYSRNRRGPAHVNFPFRKPLEPSPSFLSETHDKNKHRHPESSSLSIEVGRTITSNVADLDQKLSQSDRPVIIAGPEDPAYTLNGWVNTVAAEYNIPILAEPGANISIPDHQIHGFAGFLRDTSTRKTLAPDLILRTGQQPVSKALHLFISEHRDVPHYHFTRAELLQDEQLATDRVYYGDPPVPEVEFSGARQEWWQAWRHAANQTEKRWSNRESKSFLTDGAVIHHLTSELPDSWSIILSNSFPVRDTALFGSPKHAKHPTYVNRGASGIDGITSTAAGIIIGDSGPGLLITGDLSFLHDTNALLNKAMISRPFIVAIINNGGGSIFRMLPISNHEKPFTTYFETPQSADLSSMADTYDISYERIADYERLRTFSPASFESEPGIHLIEFQTDAELSMQERRLLWNYDETE